jgi:phage FluMu gp28-like protein
MNRPPFVAANFPGHCKIFPERNVMLLSFQQRWVTDNSRLKLAVKARQIGAMKLAGRNGLAAPLEWSSHCPPS